MIKLEFSVSINAPVAQVWEIMIDPESYKAWTRPFCEGSYFIGSWDEGQQIRFLSPDGGGMTSVVAENRFLEYISIKHLGFIKGGIDDTESEEVKSWAPAYENYTFTSNGNATIVDVDMDITADFEAYMLDTWPKALAVLKSLCEE